MTSGADGDEDSGVETSLDVLFAGLADSDRRHILGLLYAYAPNAMTVRDLATSLGAAPPENDRAEQPGKERQRTLVRLHHTHLPKLEAAGLIDRDEGRVSVTDHPAYDDPGIISAIGDDQSADVDSLDRLFRALTDPRRRTVLDVLGHQFGPIHTETLARELGARALDVPESAVPAEYVEERLVGLYHLDIPHLSEAGLIEHDPDADTLVYRGHPELRVPWMRSVLAPDFRSSLTGEVKPRELGTVHGREAVISFGRSLCERADEELFCMFTDTDLLEAGCLTRIRDASRKRGATVYLGTPNPTVQEYVREHAPEVVLWEPKTNWLNLTVAGTRVGRLLLADREAVMLGTLDEEKDAADFRGEKSIIGEGADNTLVVMVTQLLNASLEQIEDGADDLETPRPF